MPFLRALQSSTPLFIALFFCFGCYGQESIPKPILIKHVNVVDVEKGSLKKDHCLLIQGDSIARIFQAGQTIDESNLQVINGENGYVIPGLFDMHVHLGTDPSGEDHLKKAKERLAVYLDHGITGVRDMAGDTRLLAYLARQSSLDEIVAPDLYFSSLMAGPSFFSDPRTAASAKGAIPGKTAWMKAISDSTDISKAVAAAKGTGATGIKLYADLSDQLCQKIIREAKAQDMKVWAHASVIPALPQSLVNAGITSLSHSTLLAWQVSEEKPLFGKDRYAETTLNPSSPAFIHLINSMAKQKVFLDPTAKIYHERALLARNGNLATKAAFDSGVELVIGTDMGVNGDNVEFFPLMDEMEYLVNEVGISEYGVLKAATINSALLLGISNQTGSIDKGKKASLVLLVNNPLENIKALRNIKLVMKNGRLIKESL